MSHKLIGQDDKNNPMIPIAISIIKRNEKEIQKFYNKIFAEHLTTDIEEHSKKYKYIIDVLDKMVASKPVSNEEVLTIALWFLVVASNLDSKPSDGVLN